MRRWLGGAAWMIVCVNLLAGCGGESSPPPAATGTAAPPLKGKDLGKASQLVGTWLAQSEGDFIGFEFMKDGKVLVTSAMSAMAGMNAGMMMDYSVMDGGRLSLTAQGGMTQVFGVTMAGDELELKGSMMLSNADSQRFRKLPSGQTLEQAVKEQEQAQAKLARERYDRVLEYIKQPGLVIVCTNNTPGSPASIAIAPADAGGMQYAFHDDPSPHKDQIYLAADISQRGDEPVVNVTFGQQVSPPPTTQSYNSPSIPFQITGDAKNPRATASVTIGGAPYDLELKRDEKLYKEIVGRFDAAQAKAEALKKPLIDLLKDYAVLEGASYSEYAHYTKPNTVRIVLLRDEKSGKYGGESILIDANTGQAGPLPQTSAEVATIDGKPMLLVNCYNRQYQLALDAATGKLTGGWFYQHNPNGFVAELKVIEASDLATRQKKHDAERKLLASVSPSQPLIGLVNHKGNFLPQPGPVVLALTADGNGQVTETATFPQVVAVVDVQGQIADTIAGPQLQLRFANLRETGSIHSGNLANVLRNQTWVYRIAGDAGSGPLRLTDGTLVLTQATDAYKAELRKNLTDALTKGLTLRMRNPDYGPTNTPQTFRFTLDPATGQVTGATLAGERPFHAQTTVTAELKDVNGVPVMFARIADPPPARQGAFHRTYTAEIAAYPSPEGWLFTAPYWPDTNDRSRQYFDLAEVRP